MKFYFPFTLADLIDGNEVKSAFYDYYRVNSVSTNNGKATLKVVGNEHEVYEIKIKLIHVGDRT